jgi:hypothetical protein
VARMGEERFCCESPREGDRWENQIVDGRMRSEWILGRFYGGGGVGLDSTGSGHEPGGSCCECDDEPPGNSATDSGR